MTDSLHTRLAVPHPRMAWLDILRGVALLAMSSYHFLWDLGDFGYIDPTYPASGWPKIYARCIASTFLFLAGFSLALAHSKTIRWRSFGLRLAKIAAAAALVTLGSYFFMPQGLIFFGILHAIATMSVIGLIFLRAHPLVIVLAAVATLIAPQYLASEAFNQPWLWWLGLSTQIRISFDYVPLLPWLCPFLLGMAASKLWLRYRPTPAEAISRPSSALARPLAFIGRQSLIFYLVHQPVMIAALFLFSMVIPAPKVDPSIAFTQSCEKSCTETREAAFCTRFCGCALEQLSSQSMLDGVVSGSVSDADAEKLETLRVECTLKAQ